MKRHVEIAHSVLLILWDAFRVDFKALIPKSARIIIRDTVLLLMFFGMLSLLFM
jgi:hypothetical protein